VKLMGGILILLKMLLKIMGLFNVNIVEDHLMRKLQIDIFLTVLKRLSER